MGVYKAAMRWAGLAWLGIGVLLCSGQALRAEEAAEQPAWLARLRLKGIVGYHFSTGKYGTTQRTDISYIPGTVEGIVDAWRLRFTFPYIRVDGGGTLVEGPTGPILTSGGTSDGFGDIIGAGSYTLWPRARWMPFVELWGRIKFPTADRSEGLGTGKFDYSLETEISDVYGRFSPFVSVGYRFFGGSELRNTWLATAGSFYQIKTPLEAGVFVYFREAATSSSYDQLEAVPFLSWKFAPQFSLGTYVSAGILDGSPDVGTGLQVSYWR
jgi:hypothetical protein